MAKIDTIFKKETRRPEIHPKRITKWIHYTKLLDNQDQYCNERDRNEIESLADLIEADGEVLQDLLVRKVDADEYEIIAGHKRRRACRILVEERGKEEYAFLPCVVKDLSDVRAEFQLYSSNSHHEKTDYERMHELERMKYLLEHFPEEFPQLQSGRMVERLAKQMNMNRTTVGEYLTISKNLGDKAMMAFEKGTLKKSAAVELSSFPEQEQEELLDRGITSFKQIKKYKKHQESENVTAKETKPVQSKNANNKAQKDPDVITVSLFFEISGPGEKNYSESKLDLSVDKLRHLNIKQYAQKQIHEFADMFGVSEKAVRLISRQEFEENAAGK